MPNIKRTWNKKQCINDGLTTIHNFKVLPPLRTNTDIEALIEGLKDGTIDMITSDHNPIDIEHKKIEFDHAKYGTIGLESAFGTLLTTFTLKKTVELLTRGKSRFGIQPSIVDIGHEANLTLFNPKGSREFDVSMIRSTSKNSMFLGSEVLGTVYGIINNNQIILN